jgi:centromere protein X
VELLRLFTLEAVHRSAEAAEAMGSTIVEPAHLERILPQLLLDFK